MVREWLVAGAVVERPEGVLLVCNRRHDGWVDWSTPGGVIDAGESVIEGLTREVLEETGLEVSRWHGPLYEVRAEAPDLGWRMRAEVHLAVAFDGWLRLDDPDGIVVDAMFVPPSRCGAQLRPGYRWVREPLEEWLVERWNHSRAFDYLVEGTDLRSLTVTRL